MSRNNTGNPIDSKAFADFEDNVKNLDQVVNSDQETWRDRLGKSRLTWAGIVKAGTGDAGVIVPIVQQAVQDVIAGVDGQVAVAQSAANRAENAADLAEDAAQYDYFVDNNTGLASLVGMTAGQRAYVRETEHVHRYNGTAWIDQGLSPTAAKEDKAAPKHGYIEVGIGYGIEVDTTAKTVSLHGLLTSGSRTKYVPPVTLSYDGASGAQIISASLHDGSAQLTPVSSADLIPQQHVTLGTLHPVPGTIVGAGGDYYRNGVPYAPPVPKVAQNATLWGLPSTVSVDTNAKTITIVSNYRITAGQRTRLTTSCTLSYDGLTGYQLLVFRDDSSDPRLVPTNQIQNSDLMSVDDLIVAMFNTNNGVFVGLAGGYTLDGVTYSPETPETFLNGKFVSSNRDTGVDVDTNAKTITLDGVILADGYGNRISGVTYNYSEIASVTTWRFLTFNRLNNTVGVRDGVSVGTSNKNSVVFLAIRPSTMELRGLDGGYTLDGRVVGGINRNACIPIPSPGALNINFAEKKLEILAPMPVLEGGWILTVEPQTVSFANIPDGVWGTVIYDPLAKQVSVIQAANEYKNMVCVLGAIRTQNRAVVGFKNYSINGVENNVHSAWRDNPATFAWDIGYDFTSPPMPAHTSSSDMPLTDITTADIYSWYDALVAAYPEYITKNFLGKDATDTFDIYEYRFKPPMARAGEFGENAPEHMRIMLTCLHSEQINYVTPYYFMKLVCESDGTDTTLEAFRHGVEWSVIPALNPYAIDNKQRPNGNGVDLNRNFPAAWQLSRTDPRFDSGPEPLSEPETQYCYNLLKEFRPHILVDCHSFGVKDAPNEDTMFWLGTQDVKVRSMCNSVITRLAHKWRKENAWIPDADKFGYTHRQIGVGMLRSTADDLGAVSIVYETALRLYSAPNAQNGSAQTITYAVEGLGNFIVGAIKTVTAG